MYKHTIINNELQLILQLNEHKSLLLDEKSKKLKIWKDV